MNFRLPAVLFVSIFVLGAALLIMSFSEPKESTDALMEELVGVKPEQIDIVEFEREDGSKIKFNRLAKDRWDEEWEVSAPGGAKQTLKAKVDAPAIDEVVKALMRAKPTATTESNPALVGLQPPSLRVTLRQGSERSSTMNFGNLTSGSNSVAFITTSTRPDRPLATLRSSVEALFRSPGGEVKAGDVVKWADDFRSKTFFGSDSRSAKDDADGLTLAAKGKTLSLEKAGANWKFVSPAGWGEADTIGDSTPSSGAFTGVSPLLGAVTSLQATQATDFVDAPSAEDLVKYGLNPGNPDILKIDVKLKDKGTTTIYLGKKDSEAVSPTSPVPASGKVWIRVEGEPGVVRANSGDLSGLLAIVENPDPLRDRTLLAIDKSLVDGLDITVGAQTAKLRKAGSIPDWKLYGNPSAGDPQATNGDAVQKILTALLERRTIKGFPPSNPANFAPPEIKAEIKIWADGFESTTDPKAEPKEKGKPTILVFGKKEGDSIYVRRTAPNGSAAEFVLSDRIKLASGEFAELLPTIAKTRLDLLDTNLKTFGMDAVGKITVAGLKNYELEKEAKKEGSADREKWIFAAPADQKGKVADAFTVDEMLRLLGTTSSVSRYVDEIPTPEKLVEYGLAAPAMPLPMSPPAPRLKVTIGLKGTDAADKERIYEFGIVTGEFVYARQPGKAAVFTLPKFVYDKFAEADLRNKAIFQIDVAQVRTLEFIGWKGSVGFVTDLVFEKKDGTWVVAKSPGPYNLDPKKLDAFLTVLNTTTVKAFVPGTIAPDQGFGDKSSLTVNIGLLDGKTLTLTLGNELDGGSSYYAAYSLLPPTAPVFTIDSTRLKGYKDSSGAFAK